MIRSLPLFAPPFDHSQSDVDLICDSEVESRINNTGSRRGSTCDACAMTGRLDPRVPGRFGKLHLGHRNLKLHQRGTRRRSHLFLEETRSQGLPTSIAFLTRLYLGEHHANLTYCSLFQYLSSCLRVITARPNCLAKCSPFQFPKIRYDLDSSSAFNQC